MARQRGSLPVEFHPTSRDGQFLSEEEYLRRRDITTKEQVAKLQQSAEYQAWAAARGRGQRQGRQYLATGSLVLAALAVIALTGLWRSMPDIQQAHIPSILRSSLLAISSPGWDLNQEVLTHYGEELEATPLLSESDLRGHLERRGSEISAKASIQGPEASEKQFSDAPQRPSTSIQEQGMHEKQLGSGEVSKLRSQIEMLQQVAEKMEGSLRDQHNQVLTLEQELANRDKTILSLRDQLQDMEDKAESLRQNYEFLLAHNTTTVATNADAAPTGRLVEAPAIAANISAMKSEVVRSETMNSADTLPSLPSNQQSLELMVLLFLISWLGLVWMYWRARQAHNKLRVADHKKVQDAQRLMAEWKEKHEQLTVQAAKIMQERNELLHKGEEMKNHGVQMQKPASEQSALDGKNVTAMVVENEHLRDQVAKKELDVLKGGLQLKKALESLNKVEQQLAKLREVCCEDDRNLRLRFLDELESNLKDFRIPTPDVRREVPASSIVRTGPAGTRKALVSLPVKDENEARQLEVRPSEAECHTLRSQLLEANKSLQEATIREAAITKETNKGVQALHDQVKALQKKNEELEHELQKRKAREERDVVLSPAAGARRLQGRASHGHGPIERELFPCDQADELDFDASSASPEDLQQRFQHYCNQYMGARMTILSLREELNNLRAVALKREDAGSLPSNDTVDDAGFREAPEALGLPVRDAPQECNREAHLTASEDDPQVLRARVAQMTADIAQIISYPGAELEMERLQRQVDAMEAELTERQADTRVAYDALQRKEEEVARLQAEIVSVTSKLEEVQNELESVKDELKVLDTSAAFAKRDLEHLKEENVLLQAQVDQVTASLLETREAKQDSEQQLQQVKQDSDDFAAMVGHYKQEIAMLEAQVKHLRDVHHEAALKLSIEGAEIEALGEQDKNQNRESLDTASQRRERVPVAALRRLMNRIEHVVELLGDTPRNSIDSPLPWSLMTPSPVPLPSLSDSHRDATPTLQGRTPEDVQAAVRREQRELASFMRECTARIGRVQEGLGTNIPICIAPSPGILPLSTAHWDPSQALEGSPELEEQQDAASFVGHDFSSWSGSGRPWSEQASDGLRHGLPLSFGPVPQEFLTNTPSSEAIGPQMSGSRVLHEGLAGGSSISTDGSDDMGASERGCVVEVSDDDVSDFECSFADDGEQVDLGLNTPHERYTQEPYVATAQR